MRRLFFSWSKKVGVTIKEESAIHFLSSVSFEKVNGADDWVLFLYIEINLI